MGLMTSVNTFVTFIYILYFIFVRLLNGGSLTAEFEIRASNNQLVPEPSTILGIVTLGLGAVLSKKRNQDNSNDS
jgi:hypothetical protein